MADSKETANVPDSRPSDTASRVQRIELHPETLAAYSEHVRIAEAGLSESLQACGPFLWPDSSAAAAKRVRDGRTIAELLTNGRPVHVRDGLIHDWIGATYIPGAKIGKTIDVVQSYDRHYQIYAPEVMDSRLVSRCGDVFEIYLRLRIKKMITVVLDTDHHVEYSAVSATRWCCNSRTTRIAEVEDAGKPTESVRRADSGYGFLWRLTSFWRFEERESGVWIDCRAISLTRDVPKGLGWVIEPMVKKVPRDSLIATLEATRRWYGRLG